MRSPVTSGGPGGGGVPSPISGAAAPGHLPSYRPYVLIPYVEGMLRDLTETAVLSSGLSVVHGWIDRDIESDYATLLADAWTSERTFVVVEQDIVPPPGAIMELVHCGALWCVHEYPVSGRLYGPLLGLAKFSYALQLLHPDAMTDALHYRKGKRSWCPWRSCSEAVASHLMGLGIEPHVHQPPAIHLHDYGTG